MLERHSDRWRWRRSGSGRRDDDDGQGGNGGGQVGGNAKNVPSRGGSGGTQTRSVCRRDGGKLYGGGITSLVKCLGGGMVDGLVETVESLQRRCL